MNEKIGASLDSDANPGTGGGVSAPTPIELGKLFPEQSRPSDSHTGRGPRRQSTCSNIETRMDRPKSVVRVIRGVA